jgi:hypothetical protein
MLSIINRRSCKGQYLWVLVSIIWMVSATSAQTTFSGQIVITNQAYSARSVFSADLDGDGDNDVLSASVSDDKIAWYENTDGLGSFGPQQIITTSTDNAVSVFSADLDGDEDNDVLSASYLDDKIAWYENTDGLGSFGPQQIISTVADGARSVFSIDLDGDGDNDVLSASRLDDKIAWYENTDGLGGFGPQQVITDSAFGAFSVFSADLDGDGDNDVLSASVDDWKIAWYENTDALGNFGPQRVINGDANYACSVFSADLDRDGDLDVLSASAGDDSIAWYMNIDGLGSFSYPRIISANAEYVSGVFSADLDDDGDNDVIAAATSGMEVTWYENDGWGNFGPAQIIMESPSGGAYSVYSTDLDGDGDNDVLSAGGNIIAWYRNELYTSVSPGEHHQSTPEKYALHQNYPNPFNPLTTISYNIPVQGIVTVNIYNVLGQKTAELVNGLVNAGQHQLTWNASDVPSGVYFVQLSGGDYQQIRKVVLLR